MPTTVNLDPVTGLAEFRKSLYDEEGDVIDLVAVEVVEIDGEEVPEGPERTPAWLTEGYTTTDEETADGPLESRRYLHLDFAIDPDHATIEKNTSYLIRVRADDNFNAEQSFDFVYTNGVLDFSTLTGLVGHFAFRLQGAGNVGTLTNFGSGGDLVGSGLADTPTMFNGRGAWFFDADGLSVGSGLLPSGSGLDPWSILFLLDPRFIGFNFSGYDLLYQKESGINGLNIRAVDTAGLPLELQMSEDGVTETVRASPPPNTLSLVEIHKSSAGVVDFRLNGVSAGTVAHTGTIPASTFRYQTNTQLEHYLSELIVIDGELTAAQKTQIRKALKALYPMSQHEVT